LKQQVPYHDTGDGGDHHRSWWKERIVMGTNQCSRILEEEYRLQQQQQQQRAASNRCHSRRYRRPSLIVLARDIYPPTMLVHIPVLAQKLGVTLLLLPGKASMELGEALRIKTTSILMFLEKDNPKININDDQPINEREKEDDNDAIDSFVEFVKEQIVPTGCKRISASSTL
jgi:hypothetical protein